MTGIFTSRRARHLAPTRIAPGTTPADHATTNPAAQVILPLAPPLAAFLHECLVEWAAARLGEGSGAMAIHDRLDALGLVQTTTRDWTGVDITINGITGSAPSLPGALRDWVARARHQIQNGDAQ